MKHGPILFAHNENIAHIMPRVTAHVMTSCMDVPFMQDERYLSKLTASHFSTLNMDFASQNVLKRILIAMLNENKADWNENFRICAEEPIAPLYRR